MYKPQGLVTGRGLTLKLLSCGILLGSFCCKTPRWHILHSISGYIISFSLGLQHVPIFFFQQVKEKFVVQVVECSSSYFYSFADYDYKKIKGDNEYSCKHSTMMLKICKVNQFKCLQNENAHLVETCVSIAKDSSCWTILDICNLLFVN